MVTALDVRKCGCRDPSNCRCPHDGGGCLNGFCFCTDGTLEYEERRCHPAYVTSKAFTSYLTQLAKESKTRSRNLLGSSPHLDCFGVILVLLGTRFARALDR